MQKTNIPFKKTKRPLQRACALLLILAMIVGTAPVLADDGYGTEPSIAAQGEMLYERNSGTLLYAKGEDKRLYPASTTKIMTALLLLEYGNLDETVTVSKTAMAAVPEGSSIAGLKAGEELTLHDLLICMLVPSGNDAANVVAEAISGSIDAFVEKMNKRAQQLDCTDTHFCNPHGFHDDDHYTTASDLLKITLAALEYPLFEEVCGFAQVTVPATNLCAARTFNSTNFMISNTETSAYLYPYCTGGKTGTTTPAGRCFVGFAEKGDLKLVSVMLNSTTEYTKSGIRRIMSFLDTEDLFDWAFKYFTWRDVVTVDDPVAEVRVSLSKENDYVVLKPSHEFSMLLYRDITDDIFTREITVDEDVAAPVRRGDRLGSMKVYYDGDLVDTIPLLASDDVERSPILFFLGEIRRTLHEPWIKWLFLGLIAAIVLYVLFVIRLNRKLKKTAARHRKHTNIRSHRR